jgi:hypothetical protein
VLENFVPVFRPEEHLGQVATQARIAGVCSHRILESRNNGAIDHRSSLSDLSPSASS